MYKGYQYELFSTSWGIHEGFKTAVDKLNELLPFEGRVEYSQSKNKNLEKFRKAQNAMYDLFNNGLCIERVSSERYSVLLTVRHMSGIRHNGFMWKRLWKHILPQLFKMQLKNKELYNGVCITRNEKRTSSWY